MRGSSRRTPGASVAYCQQKKQVFGTLKLPPGPAKLTLEPLAMPGGQDLDLKHVELTRYQP
jgi:hypothetical protein